MYIFISLVYFVVLFQTGHQMLNVHTTYTANGKAQAAIDSIVKDPQIPANVKKVLIEKIKKNTPPAIGKSGNVAVNMEDDQETANRIFLSPTSSDSTYAAYLASQQKLPADQHDGFITRYYNKKTYAYRAKYGNRTKDVIIEEFKHNIPKMMFLLLPFCALILMVTFRKNRKYYVEHLIYSFHLHCFIFLFLVIIMLLQWLIPSEFVSGILSFIAFLTITWYIYRSLKVIYGRSRWRTISKLIGASIMYFIGFMVCVSLAFMITAIFAS